jgi:hypothetical protein
MVFLDSPPGAAKIWNDGREKQSLGTSGSIVTSIEMA